MRKGSVSGVFFAVYNSGARGATPEKYQDALKIIELVKSQVSAHPNDLVLGTSTADIVVSATPADLAQALTLDKPMVRVTYDYRDTDPPYLTELVDAFVDGAGR